MKRVLYIILSVLVLINITINESFADETINAATASDGYIFVITIDEQELSEDTNLEDGITSHYKTFTCKYNGETLWKVTLKGYFQYNGVTATCVGSSCTATVYASSWSCSYKTSYESGNQAIGEATMVKKFLGITIDSQSVHLTLVCDKDGNVY